MTAQTPAPETITCFGTQLVSTSSFLLQFHNLATDRCSINETTRGDNSLQCCYNSTITSGSASLQHVKASRPRSWRIERSLADGEVGTKCFSSFKSSIAADTDSSGSTDSSVCSKNVSAPRISLFFEKESGHQRCHFPLITLNTASQNLASETSIKREL